MVRGAQGDQARCISSPAVLAVHDMMGLQPSSMQASRYPTASVAILDGESSALRHFSVGADRRQERRRLPDSHSRHGEARAIAGSATRPVRSTPATRSQAPASGRRADHDERPDDPPRRREQVRASGVAAAVNFWQALEAFYDAVPRPSARVEDHGPLVLFLQAHPNGHPFYARPAHPFRGTPTVEDVVAVRARQRELGVPESFEWVHEVTPGLLEVAEGAGLHVLKAPLLLLDPDDLPAADPRARVLADAPEEIGVVARLAFASPGIQQGAGRHRRARCGAHGRAAGAQPAPARRGRATRSRRRLRRHRPAGRRRRGDCRRGHPAGRPAPGSWRRHHHRARTRCPRARRRDRLRVSRERDHRPGLRARRLPPRRHRLYRRALNPPTPPAPAGGGAIVGPGFWDPVRGGNPTRRSSVPADRPCPASVQAPTSSMVTAVA